MSLSQIAHWRQHRRITLGELKKGFATLDGGEDFRTAIERTDFDNLCRDFGFKPSAAGQDGSLVVCLCVVDVSGNNNPSPSLFDCLFVQQDLATMSPRVQESVARLDQARARLRFVHPTRSKESNPSTHPSPSCSIFVSASCLLKTRWMPWTAIRRRSASALRLRLQAPPPSAAARSRMCAELLWCCSRL